MYLRGTPMIYKERGYRAELAVYHSGGGLGGQRLKVFLSRQGIVPRVVTNMRTLGDEPLEFESLVAIKWEAQIPADINIDIKNWRVERNRTDYANTSKTVYLLNTPREEWSHLSDRWGGWSTQLDPQPCMMAENGAGIVVDDLFVSIEYGDRVNIQPLDEKRKYFEYSPNDFEDSRRQIILPKIQLLLNEYEEFVKTGKLRKEE